MKVEIVDLWSRDALRASSLSEKDDALPRVEDVEADRDDAQRRVEAVEVSCLTEYTELQAASRATGEVQAKHDVLLRQMINATWKVSCLESDILRVRKGLATTTEPATCGCAAVAVPT